jgi:hypothetical protein
VVFFIPKEDPILAVLRQAENGTTVAEICRKVGISEQTFLRGELCASLRIPSTAMRLVAARTFLAPAQFD